MYRVPEKATHKTAYYLSHHCVVKADNSSTKMRIIDASSATDNGISFNDLQLVGPTIQEDLFLILISCRAHSYISADIEKMYRQVLVNPDQRVYQRILWRSKDKEPIHTFELSTLTVQHQLHF